MQRTLCFSITFFCNLTRLCPGILKVWSCNEVMTVCLVLHNHIVCCPFKTLWQKMKEKDRKERYISFLAYWTPIKAAHTLTVVHSRHFGCYSYIKHMSLTGLEQ